MADVLKPAFLCGQASAYDGPADRRCEVCGDPVPPDYVPSARLDGSLEVLCATHDRERIETRNEFIHRRIGTRTA